MFEFQILDTVPNYCYLDKLLQLSYNLQLETGYREWDSSQDKQGPEIIPNFHFLY